MLKAEAQLEKEIKELMRKAEILDAQEDSKYGKGKLGSDLPKELQLWGLTHNINKLWRHQKQRRCQEAMATG
jgi:hypothetical protein